MQEHATPPPVLRQISVRAAMEVLLKEGPTSRAALSKKTGLSKQTMSEVIRALEQNGWVRVSGRISGKVGRSAVAYEVAPDGGYAIGIDFGATTIRIALVSVTGDMVQEGEFAVGGKTGAALIEHLGACVSNFITDAVIPLDKLLLGAVATPGVIDTETGDLQMAPNMPETGGLKFVDYLSEAIGCPVVVENDVNAAVLGESWKGRSAGISDAAFIMLGTGVGLGMLIDGKLIKGARGAAGEISYLPLGSDPYSTESLDRGALETAISAAGLMSRYRAAGGQQQTVIDLFREAEAGHTAARETIAQTARLAAMLVLSVDAMIDPQAIFLGGNVGRHPLLFGMIEDELPRLTRRKITLEVSALGARATVVGAAAIALNRMHNSLFSPKDFPTNMQLP